LMRVRFAFHVIATPVSDEGTITLVIPTNSKWSCYRRYFGVANIMSG
jgi:hypothetical protein